MQGWRSLRLGFLVRLDARAGRARWTGARRRTGAVGFRRGRGWPLVGTACEERGQNEECGWCQASGKGRNHGEVQVDWLHKVPEYTGTRQPDPGFAMWLIFLEAGLALLLLFLIVWATWPKRRPPTPSDDNINEKSRDD